jgi:uridine kinase
MTRIIAITGGSGAGKTTIARALARLIDAPVIAEDDYYRCASAIAGFDPDTHNFDAPAAKEHELLAAHLSLARSGLAFEKPLYDLVTHTRRATIERIEPKSALIIVGLHLLTAPALRASFDFKVYVEAEESVRLGRRVVRDVAARGRTPESVVTQFFANVRPMHEAHVAPQQAFADLVLFCPHDADPAHAEQNAARIAEALKP